MTTTLWATPWETREMTTMMRRRTMMLILGATFCGGRGFVMTWAARRGQRPKRHRKVEKEEDESEEENKTKNDISHLSSFILKERMRDDPSFLLFGSSHPRAH